jgi:type IVB pilus formation R64 PilN family outer membrane protein
MFKKWIALLLSSALMLSACHSQLYNQAEGNIAEVKLKSAAARKKSDDSAKPEASLVVNQGMYVDTTPINLVKDPYWLRNQIVIRGDQLPFSYYSRTIANGAGTNILVKFQNGLDQSTPITMSYSGTIKGALDLIASKTGYVYSVRGKQIYWQAFITKTFDIAFMPGESEYLLGKANNAGQGGNQQQQQAAAGSGQVSNYTTSDTSQAEFSNLTGKISIWTDLNDTVKQLLSPDGKIIVSQSTTSVTVRDRPTNVELVSRYIANLNHNLSKQVLVKVEVLEVILENDFEYGVNWQLIANAFNKSPFVINGSYGTPVSISTIAPFATQSALPTPGAVAPNLPVFGTQVQPGTNNPIPSYTLLLNALNQQGKASVVSEPRVVCLNNQVSVVRIVQSQGYLASVQNTSLAGGGTAPTATVTTQLTPGSVVTGLTLYILPKILNKNVYLQVNADLSTAQPFETIGSNPGQANNTQIQVPNITEKHFNQRSVIKSGDTLILAGFRQVSNVANANQFITSQALGGKGAKELNSETIVLITPIILNGSL